MNFKRKKFLSIIFSILKGEVSTLVVAHKDRLCRFAFEFIQELANSVGCEIVVANQESLSPQQELVEDLMAIIHCFSCRLYGLRNYSKELKAKIQLAKHHARVANLRKDTLHKITTFLCKNHAKIVVQDLNIYGMLANHKLAQVIADCGFHEFKRQLEYKALLFGCEIIIADRWYPSSKTCSKCGHIQEMPLIERTYNCRNCKFSLDRDLNAAINLSRWASS